MNFKPTKRKLIAGIVIPIVIWALVFFIGLLKITGIPAVITNFLVLHNFPNFFSAGNIVLFASEVIIVYLFLSIFHRKKKKASAYPPQENPVQVPVQPQ